MSKTAIITFRNIQDDSDWGYEILINGESVMSLDCDPFNAPEDCTRYRDFEDLSNHEEIFRKIEGLVRDCYSIEYNYDDQSETYTED